MRSPAAPTSAAPVLRVGDVACDRKDAVEPGDGPLERSSAARVDDEPPAALCKRAGEGEAEPSRRAGDDSDS